MPSSLEGESVGSRFGSVADVMVSLILAGNSPLSEEKEQNAMVESNEQSNTESSSATSARARLKDLAVGRLGQQIEFIIEIDRLKTVLRRTVLTDGSRAENTAEHSWHIAVMVLTLAEWANQPIDASRVVKMLLLHDIVEVDAGDTFCYDEGGNLDKAEREQRAADRIFGLLPEDQEREFRALWEEFEARETMDARFANGVDRLQPMLHNFLTEGHSWRVHGIKREQVEARNRAIGDGSETLWEFASGFLDEAEREGWFGPSNDRATRSPV